MSLPLKVLGIYREEKYSNRAVSADRAIMDEVLKNVWIKFQDDVVITAARSEDISLKALDFDFDLIFSMAQDESILHALDELESRGSVVVNSSKAIRNCFRKKLSEQLCDEAFSYPRYVVLNLEQDAHEAFYCENGYWIKRGDFHAIEDDDVLHIECLNDLNSKLTEFRKRGVTEVILQENCHGELFKFYGVRNSFFNLRYMGRTSKDRYSFVDGNSRINFDRVQLELLVHKAANILDLDYFGGDCIITQEGKMHFIDFNDWPSFRTCLKDVAPVMVSYALKKLNRETISDSSINQ